MSFNTWESISTISAVTVIYYPEQSVPLLCTRPYDHLVSGKGQEQDLNFSAYPYGFFCIGLGAIVMYKNVINGWINEKIRILDMNCFDCIENDQYDAWWNLRTSMFPLPKIILHQAWGSFCFVSITSIPGDDGGCVAIKSGWDSWGPSTPSTV